MKPTAKQFNKAASACRGNFSRIADLFGVTRQTVWRWCKGDSKFAEIIREQKGRLVDDIAESGRLLALGVPKYDANGNFLGWIERPDERMVRYMLGIYGRDEGFTEQLDLKMDFSKLTDRQLMQVADGLLAKIKSEDDK